MVYVLYGKIQYLIDQESKKILNGIDDINITKYNLSNTLLDNIINDANSMSLFSEKKGIVIENAYIFTASTKKELEQNTDGLLQYLDNINTDTILIFVVNEEKIDERKKITKLIRKNGYVIEFNSTDTKKIVKDLFDDYVIDDATINFMIDRVGDNITLLDSEINKIKIYKDTNKEITKEDIVLLTSKSLEENNFKLIDAVVNKNKSLALSLYNDRIKLNEEPIAIIVALANQIRIMYQVKQLYMNGYTEGNIASILGIHPYRVKLAAQNSSKYDSDLLLSYIKRLSDLDINIKTGKIDKSLGLELFILAL